MSAAGKPLPTSPGCVDSLAKGWVVTVEGQRCRVLGRVDPTRWRLERIDTPTRQTFTVPMGAPPMARVEGSLRSRGLLGNVVAQVGLFGRTG